MSDTARMLDDTLTRLLGRHLSNSASYDAQGLSEQIQTEISEAGLDLVLAAETEGGLGGTLSEAATVAWRCGWFAAPVPIVEMLLRPIVEQPANTQGPDAMANLGDRIGTLPPHITAQGMLLTAAQMVGAMARIMELATDYANTRVQFGRPLAKFQTIQHRLAEAASELVVAEAARANAREVEDEGRGAQLMRLSAKAQAGTAATIIAASVHQIFGAVGFTQDHELHRYTRSLWNLRDAWGRQADCDLAIGRAACAEPDGLWSYIVDEKRVRYE